MEGTTRIWHATIHRRSLVLAFFGGRAMASAGVRAYNGGLGAVPPAGSRGRAQHQKLNTTIHFISQFSPNFDVILVKSKFL